MGVNTKPWVKRTSLAKLHLLLYRKPRTYRRQDVRDAVSPPILGPDPFRWGLRATTDPSPGGTAIRPSLEHLGSLLDGGWRVGIFPGAIKGVGKEILPFQSGTWLLAVEFGPPVITVRLVAEGAATGPMRWAPFREPVSVPIGKPSLSRRAHPTWRLPGPSKRGSRRCDVQGRCPACGYGDDRSSATSIDRGERVELSSPV